MLSKKSLTNVFLTCLFNLQMYDPYFFFKYMINILYVYYKKIFSDSFLFYFITFRVNSRAEFSIWCCKLHNEVNEKLGYENKYNSCDLAALDERWKVGRKACWDADD